MAQEDVFFEKPYAVTIGEQNEWVGGSRELTRHGLVWFIERFQNRHWGPRLGDREVDSKWFANLTIMPPFSRLWLGPSRSVPKVCWRETQGKTCGDLL